MDNRTKYELAKGVIGLCLGSTIGRAIRNVTNPTNIIETVIYAVGSSCIAVVVGNKVEEYIDENFGKIILDDKLS